VQAILLYSHGSVLCGAEQNLVETAQRMREAGDAPIVEVAFLNYNQPSFDDAVRRCVEQGATRIVVAPWFLVAGKFVVDDLPPRIAAATQAHPGLELVAAGVIGFHPAMVDAVLASAGDAPEPAHWRATVADAGRWCRENPRCPLYGEHPCRVRRA
jgi:sirohydrochlorin ferrochelatase